MAVRIDEINVQGVGPLSRFRMQLGTVNLIYGRNECGKTYLVEFLIRCLFKNTTAWTLRSALGQGQVHVSGLASSPVAFSPTSKRKLEAYLDETTPGLPRSLSKLLVVKGAELTMADSGGADIGQKVLKEYLSAESILESVESRIPKALQGARVEIGRIVGRNQGKLKDLDKVESDITRISGLFDQVDEQFSEGERQTRRIRLAAIEKDSELQQRAKRHLAYRLHGEIEDLECKLSQVPEDDLRKLDEALHDCSQLETEVDRLQQEHVEAESRSAHFLWVKNAVQVYEDIARKGSPTPAIVLPIVAGILLVAAVIAAVLPGLGRFTYLAPILIIVGMLVGLLSVLVLRRATAQALKDSEIHSIAAEYADRFDGKLAGLPGLKEKQEQLERDYHRAALLADQRGEKIQELAALKETIRESFRRLVGVEVEPENWAATAKDLQQRRTQLEDRHRDTERRLDRLGVDEQSYLADDGLPKYDSECLNRLVQEEGELRSQIEADERQLNSLKQSICTLTLDQIGVAWEQLLDNLRRMLDERTAEYRKLSAQVVAAIVTYDALADLRAAERDQLVRGLQSPMVLGPLKAITRRYEQIDLNADSLLLSDPYGSYELASLSTGTQEQILLALRIGFAARLLGGTTLFLILDDAFQHSDWQRREFLLDQALELAQQGWQIIYLTMDDHIRDLFHTKARPQFGDHFCFQELPEAFTAVQ